MAAGMSGSTALPLWQRQFADLRSSAAFPGYAELPNEHEFHPDYYVQTGPVVAKHRKHWALLSEIVDVVRLKRIVLHARDKAGQETRIAFYTSDLGAGIPKNLLRRGYTVVNLYGLQHQFFDGSFGIREEDADSVKIIPMSLDDLFQLSDRVHIYCSDRGDGLRKCHGCGKEAKDLQRCSKCSMFWYCSKASQRGPHRTYPPSPADRSQDCQAAGWKDNGHSNDCRVLQDSDVQVLFKTDWSRFDEFIRLQAM